MHGYFVDIRLYRKAKSVAEPFAYEEYRRKKIREKIESERTNRVQVQVNYLYIYKALIVINTYTNKYNYICMYISEIACCEQRTCSKIN